MGGAVRTIFKAANKVANPFVKAITKAGMELTGAPSAAQVAAQQRAAAEAQRKAAEEARKKQEAAIKAQQAVETVDAPGVNPDDVVYSGEGGEGGKKKKKRKSGGTIMTSTKGVMGDAPTEKKTLLGG